MMPFLPALALALLVGSPVAATDAEDVYREDIAFALDELERACGHFFRQKEIEWGKVRREFTKLARGVETDAEHRVLLMRLLARLRDGHAAVVALEKGEDVGWPQELQERWESETGPGMFWCRIEKKLYVKNAWSTAEQVGIRPGMEILEVDGRPAAKWLSARIAERGDLRSFSSEQQALFDAFHWGLAQPVGTRMKLVLKAPKGKKVKRTLTYDRASPVAQGPAFFPRNLTAIEHGQRYGRTEEGFGYIHIRRVKAEICEQMDRMLAELDDPPGLILDFRANGGGGCDHDALFGRFVPTGRKLRRANAYPIPSAGPDPYGGPIVVIVDGATRSAGETASGMFKEDGRAYMIGESATAGMSASKTTIELPSRLFGLYVAVASNKGRFNGGRGVEGIGIVPHEIVEYRPEDLAAGIDTLIRRAEELLGDFPSKEVPYDPKEHGWRPK